MTDRLETWEGVLSAAEVDALNVGVLDAVYIGQRPGDFCLGKGLVGGVAAWPSGRCFNECIEIRWWASDNDGQLRNVLILNGLPEGISLPRSMQAFSAELAANPEDTRYLCIGKYDANRSDGSHLWWETRYSRPFHYLNSPPPRDTLSNEDGGRVYLRARVYELADGRTQHRLIQFEHSIEKERAS